MRERANMLLKQWESEVAWFAQSAKLRSTLSEAAAGAAECVSKAYWRVIFYWEEFHNNSAYIP